MRNILLIDDSEILNSLVGEFLTSHGYEVLAATSADQAYQFLNRQTPDLILLDIQLPDIGGFELCKFLRNRPQTRQVPIIMITATATEVPHRIKGFQTGADDYLTKPFDMTELLERVRAVLRRAPAREAEKLSVDVETKVENPPATATGPRSLPWGEVVSKILLSPFSWPDDMAYPGVALAFLVLLTCFLMLGLAFAPGVMVRPLMVCLLAFLIWGFLVSVLVITCSFLGLSLKWKEGSRLMSLAGFPILLKLLGAGVLATCTSLSPYYFTAGPALFLKDASFWVARLDAFELWTVGLLWILLKKHRGGSVKSATIGATLVWIASMASLLAVEKFGGQL